MSSRRKITILVMSVLLASFILGLSGSFLFEEVVGASGRGITVTSPNGGERWRVGTTREITWTSTGEIDFVKIYALRETIQTKIPLYLGEAERPPVEYKWFEYPIIERTRNTGSYKWIIPQDIMIPPSSFRHGYYEYRFALTGNFKICVRSIDRSGVKVVEDCSDRAFTIREIRRIIMISPKGGEQWMVKRTYKIRWSGMGDDKVGIVLYKGREVALQIAVDVLGGEYSWAIPETLDSANNYYIGIYEYPWEPGGAVGYSSAFSIIKLEAEPPAVRFGLYGICKEKEHPLRCVESLLPASCETQEPWGPGRGTAAVCACPTGYRKVEIFRNVLTASYSCYKE